MSERQAMTQQETNSKSNQNSQSTQDSQQTQLERFHQEQTAPGALSRIVSDPFSASAEDMLAMQQMLGNRILGHIVQAKLSFGSATNLYEKEADQFAEQAINYSKPNTAVKKPSITPLTQTAPNETTSSNSGPGNEVASHWESRLKSSKSSGSPLPDDTRQFMESRLGSDFSQVRVHTGFEAGHLNQEINAEAFTHGNDIYMAEGRYQPQSQAGQQLLAHELTHVVQQSTQSDGQASQSIQCKGNWLSRLFSHKKKDPDKQPGPQPSSSVTATAPPVAKWAGAHSSASSRPAGPSIGGNRIPKTSSSDSGTYVTPVTADHVSDSGTYMTPFSEIHDREASPPPAPAPRAPKPDSNYLPGGFGPVASSSSSGSDSGTYTTPVAEEHASDSGTYTTPLAEDHASDSGSYSTPFFEIHDREASPPPAPAPRAPKPDSHYLPGGFSQMASSSGSGPGSSSSSSSGAYVTPEERTPVPRSATSPRTAPSPSSSAAAASAFTMPRLAKFDDETEEQGFWGSRGGAPTYYQPADQPNPYELEIQDGRFRHKGGELLDTQNILPYQRLKDKAHRHMFTMGGHGELHSADVGQGMAEHGRVHHTTMSGGRETAAAGELRVNQGKLETVSDASGHYMPGTAQTYQALQHFASRGVDLGATNVELTGKEDDQRALSLSATELMAYKPEMEAALQGAQDYRSSHSLESGDRKHRDKSASRIRGILSAPEEKIRAAHARKDRMLDELRERTAATRQRLDASGPLPQQGRRDLSLFEYEEEMRGYDQASSSQSRRMTPEAAKAAQAELNAHWREQQERKKRE